MRQARPGASYASAEESEPLRRQMMKHQSIALAPRDSIFVEIGSHDRLWQRVKCAAGS